MSSTRGLTVNSGDGDGGGVWGIARGEGGGSVIVVVAMLLSSEHTQINGKDLPEAPFRFYVLPFAYASPSSLSSVSSSSLTTTVRSISASSASAGIRPFAR